MSAPKPKAKARAATPEEAALAAMRHIAGVNPFQRSRRGQIGCLFCALLESRPRPEPSAHDETCIWRRAVAAGTSGRGEEAEAVAHDFAAEGPWLRSGKDGAHACVYCGEAEPAHVPACVYWRLEVKRLTAE